MLLPSGLKGRRPWAVSRMLLLPFPLYCLALQEWSCGDWVADHMPELYFLAGERAKHSDAVMA